MALPTLSEFASQNPTDDPLDLYKRYSDYTKTELLKAGEWDDELVNSIDANLIGKAQVEGLDLGTDPLATFQSRATEDGKLRELRQLESEADERNDPAATVALRQYASALSPTVKQSYTDPVAYNTQLQQYEEAAKPYLSDPEAINRARRRAMERGETPVALVKSGDREDIELSPALLDYVGDDQGLGMLLENHPEVPRSLIPAIRQKLSVPEGYKAPVMAFQRQADFFTAAEKDYSTYINSAADSLSKGDISAMDGVIQSAMFGMRNSFGTKYSEDELRNYFTDAVKQRANPDLEGQNPLMELSTGEIVAPLNLAFDKQKFDAAIDSASIPEVQKTRLREQRVAQLNANAPSVFGVIAGYDENFVPFKEKMVREGKSNAEILDTWNANPERKTANDVYLSQAGAGVKDAIVGIPLGIAALAGSDTAKQIMYDHMKEDGARRAYSQLMGRNTGIGYDLMSVIPQLGADIAISVGTGGVGAGLVATKATTRTALKLAMKNMLGPEFKTLASRYLRNVTEDVTADQVYKLAARDMAAYLTPKLTNAAFLGTAFTRSAGSAYASISSALEAKGAPPDQVRSTALGHALIAGTITAAVTKGMSLLGQGGMESIFDDLSRPQLNRVFNKVKAEWGNLSPAVREGINMESANAMLASIMTKAVKPIFSTALTRGTGEAVEEGLDQFAQNINQSLATGDTVNLAKAAQEAGYAAMLGGVMGAGIPAIRDAYTGVTGKEAPQVLQDAARTRLFNDTAAKLDKHSPQTAALMRALANQAPATRSVPEAVPPAGPVEAPSGQAVAGETGEPVGEPSVSQPEQVEYFNFVMGEPEPEAPAAPQVKSREQLDAELASIVSRYKERKGPAIKLEPIPLQNPDRIYLDQLPLKNPDRILLEPLDLGDIALYGRGLSTEGNRILLDRVKLTKERGPQPVPPAKPGETRLLAAKPSRAGTRSGLVASADQSQVAPAPTPVEAQGEAEQDPEFQELQGLMQQRGQAQNKVKGVKFSAKEETRFKQLSAKFRDQLFETTDPVNDPVVGVDINGTNIQQSKRGTFYTFENGRVRSGPAFSVNTPAPTPFSPEETLTAEAPDGAMRNSEGAPPAAPLTPSTSAEAVSQPLQPGEQVLFTSSVPGTKEPVSGRVVEIKDGKVTVERKGIRYPNATATRIEVTPGEQIDITDALAEPPTPVEVAATAAAPEIALREDPDTLTQAKEFLQAKGVVADGLSETDIAKLIQEEFTPRKRPEGVAKPGQIRGELERHNFSQGLTPFLQSVAKSGETRYRAMAKLLLGYPELLANTPVTLVDLPNSEYAGAFIPSTGQIAINEASKGPRGAVDTVIHELLHAATVRSLVSPTEAQRKFIARLDRLRETVSRRAAAEGITGMEYALGSNDEFITHWFTSPKFQENVGRLTQKGERNLGQVILDTIKSLITGKPLSQIDRSINALMDEMLTFTEGALETTWGQSRMDQLMQQPPAYRDISRMEELQAMTQRTPAQEAELRGLEVRQQPAEAATTDTTEPPQPAEPETPSYTETLRRADEAGRAELPASEDTQHLTDTLTSISNGLGDLRAPDYRVNPERKSQLITYLRGVVRHLAAAPYDPETATTLDRAARFLAKSKDNFITRPMAPPLDMDEVGPRFQRAESPEDQSYMDVVERGDMATAQRMVDAAAKAAGYTVGPLLHNSTKDFTEFKESEKSKKNEMFSFGFHFTDSPDLASRYGDRQVSAYLKVENPLDARRVIYKGSPEWAWLKSLNRKLRGFPMEGKEGVYFENELDAVSPRKVRDALRAAGHDGLIYKAKFGEMGAYGITPLAEGDTTIVLNPNQIKSADPVTYDEQGNVIPLSQRFNSATPDIRFQPTDPENLTNYLHAHDGTKFEDLSSDQPQPGFLGTLERIFTQENDMRKPWRVIKKITDFTRSAAAKQGGAAARPLKAQFDKAIKAGADPDKLTQMVGASLGTTAPMLTEDEAIRIHDLTDQRLLAAKADLEARTAAAMADRGKASRSESIRAKKLKKLKTKVRREAKKLVNPTPEQQAEYDALVAEQATLEASLMEARGKLKTLEDTLANLETDHAAAVQKIMEDDQKERILSELEFAKKARTAQDLAMQDLTAAHPELAEAVGNMRTLLNAFQDEVYNRTGHRPELQMKIDRSRGIYLVRSYRLHQDPSLGKRILEDPKYKELRDRTITFFKQKFADQWVAKVKDATSKSAQQIDSEAGELRLTAMTEQLRKLAVYANYPDSDLRKVAEHEVEQQARHAFEDFIIGRTSMRAEVPGLESIKVDAARFMQKGNVPKEIRDALLENTDPLFNATHTFNALANIVVQHDMLTRFRDAGMKQGWLVDAEGKAANKDLYKNWEPVVTANDANAAWSAMAGIYAAPEDIEAFHSAFKSGSRRTETTAARLLGSLNKKLIGFAGLSLGIVTQGNPAYYPRNVVNGAFIMAANGVNPIGMAKGFKKLPRVLKEESGTFAFDDMHALRNVALGLVQGGSVAADVQSLMQQYDTDPVGTVDKMQGWLAERWPAAAAQLGKGREAHARALDAIGNLAAMSEGFANHAVFDDRVKMLTEAKFGTPEEIFREAARRTLRTTPVRSERPQFITAFGQSGLGALVAPFIGFKSDVVRMTVNLFADARTDMKSDNPVIRAHGRKVFASASMVVVGVGSIFPMISAALMGIGDDEDRALRAAMPEYAKNSSFIYWRDPKTPKQITTADLTFLNSYSFLTDPLTQSFTSIRRGRFGDIPELVARTFGQEIFGENVVAGAVMDVKRNINESTGRPIYLESDTFGDKTQKALSHVFDSAYKPAVWKKAVQFQDSLNRTSRSDESIWYTPMGVLIGAIAPMKPRVTQIDDANYRAMAKLRNANSQLWQISAPLKSPAALSTDKARDIVDDRVEATRRIFSEGYELVQGFRKLGMSDREIMQNAVDSGFSERSSKLLMQGYAMRPVLDKESLQKIYALSPERYRAIVEQQDKHAVYLKVSP